MVDSLPMNRPDIDVDTSTGATYIHITNNPVAKTVEVLTGKYGLHVMVDVDADDMAVGVEIL